MLCIIGDRYIVIDEAHVYNGIFGAHCSLIFTRLHRICCKYNSNPQVIACSATIGNPKEHYHRLLPNFAERELELIQGDSAAMGDKYFALWQADTSPFRESAWIFCSLLLQDIRVLMFCKVYKFNTPLAMHTKSNVKLVEKTNRVSTCSNS